MTLLTLCIGVSRLAFRSYRIFNVQTGSQDRCLQQSGAACTGTTPGAALASRQTRLLFLQSLYIQTGQPSRHMVSLFEAMINHLPLGQMLLATDLPRPQQCHRSERMAFHRSCAESTSETLRLPGQRIC